MSVKYLIAQFVESINSLIHFLSLHGVVHNQQHKNGIFKPKAINKELQMLWKFLKHLWRKPARPIPLMLPLLQGLSFCHPYFRPLTNVTIILYSYYLYYYYYYSFVLLLCNVCLLIMLMFMFIPSNFSLIFFVLNK